MNKKGEANKTKQDRRQRGGQNQTRKKRRGGKKASGGQQKRNERTPGKAAGSEERKSHRPRRRTRAALAYNMVERAKSHRAEAFVAMKSSEESCQAITTHHAKHDECENLTSVVR